MGATAATFALAAANGFLLATLILLVRANRDANRFLACLIALVALRLCIYALGFAGVYDRHPLLTFMPLDMSASFGPLVYLYVKSLTGSIPKRWPWHLAPGLLQFSYQLVCFGLPLSLKWSWYAGVHLHYVEPIVALLIVLQCCGYIAAAWRRQASYQAWLDGRFGNCEPWRLDWLRAMLAACACVLAGALMALTWSLAVVPLPYLNRAPVMGALALLAYLLGLLGWRFGSVPFPCEEPVAPEPAEPLRAARADYVALVARWRHRVEAAEWWREERLTLADLAGRLCVSERTLSRGLREGGAGNFNTFINTLRVRAVQRAILEGSPEDLLSLALASGFASKASFNRAFRRTSGQAPSHWRRAAQKSPTEAVLAF